MNNFTDEEFKGLLNRIPTVNGRSSSRPKAYSIHINGDLFVTNKGKSVWKQRNHASCAFRLALEKYAKRMVSLRLQGQGIDRFAVWKQPEYITAFEDFKEALIEKGIFKIIELQ